MPTSKRRYLTTVSNNWREPEYESAIKKYPPAIASFVSSGAAVLIGLMLSFVIIVAIWLFAAHGDESTVQVVRAAAIAWQATHLVPVTIGKVPVGILPWGFMIIPGFIIWRSMHWALKSAQPKSGREFWLVANYFSISYGLFSGLVTLLTETEDLKTSFQQAVFQCGLIAIIISISVLLNFAPSPTLITDKLPRDFVSGFRPGFIAFGIFWLISALTTTVALILRFDEVKAVSGLMAPSSIDQVFLIILCIGYLPTVITWTYSYLLGAGIHLGGSAIVTTTFSAPGALPAFPLLSILPSTVHPLAKYLIAVPLSVGVLIYFLVPREPWKAQGDTLPVILSHVVRIREITRILFALLILIFCAFLIVTFSSGSLGTEYLAFIGPKPIEVIFWTIKVTGAAALITLVLPRFILSLIYWWMNRPKNQSRNLVNRDSVD